MLDKPVMNGSEYLFLVELSLASHFCFDYNNVVIVFLL